MADDITFWAIQYERLQTLPKRFDESQVPRSMEVTRLVRTDPVMLSAEALANLATGLSNYLSEQLRVPTPDIDKELEQCGFGTLWSMRSKALNGLLIEEIENGTGCTPTGEIGVNLFDLNRSQILCALRWLTARSALCHIKGSGHEETQDAIQALDRLSENVPDLVTRAKTSPLGESCLESGYGDWFSQFEAMLKSVSTQPADRYIIERSF